MSYPSTVENGLVGDGQTAVLVALGERLDHPQAPALSAEGAARHG